MFGSPGWKWTFSSLRLLGFLSVFDVTGRYIDRALPDDGHDSHALGPGVEFAGALVALQHEVARMRKGEARMITLIDEMRARLDAAAASTSPSLPQQRGPVNEPPSGRISQPRRPGESYGESYVDGERTK